MMNNIKEYIKQRKTYVTWIFSYFVIVVIFMIMSSIFYLKSLDVTRNEVNEANLLALETVRESIDEKLESAKELDSQLAVDPNIQMYAKKGSKADFSKFVYTMDFLENFKKYKTIKGDIEDYFLIFHNKDVCFSSQGKYNMKLFYDVNVVRGSIISEESWEYINNKKCKNEFVILSASSDKNKKNLLAYVSTLPFSYEDDPEATIIITLSNKAFYEINERFGEHPFFIIDENDKVIMSNKPESAIQNVKYADLKEGHNILYSKNESGNMVYSYIKSNESEWKYVVAMPTQAYESSLSRLKNLSFVFVIIACLIGICVSVWFSRKNYKPLSDIIKILPHVENGEQNEFGIIKNTINSILNEREKITDDINEQKNKLKYFFVSDVVKGVIHDEKTIQKGFEAYAIKKLSEKYGVILIYVEDMGDIIYDNEAGDEIEAWNLIQFIIRNIGEELVSEKHTGFVMNTDGIMCCFINFDICDIEEAEKDMKNIAEKIQYVLDSNFHIITTVAIGEVLNGYSGINTSYKQALDCLEYRMIAIENRIINYKTEVYNKNFFKYEMVVENELINNIKIGNYEVTEKTINELFNQNFKDNVLSVHMAKIFKIELFSTILKVMNELNSSYQSDLAGKVHRIEKLLKNENIEETKEELLQILKEVCQYISENKKSHNDNLCDNILKEINEKLFDQNLNAQSIADSIGISGNYVLRFFKEQTGEGLMDYIHKLRVQKAKELLENSNFSVNEIAFAVGYCSVNTFIRSFKKIEGMPPGSYRNNIEHKK